MKSVELFLNIFIKNSGNKQFSFAQKQSSTTLKMVLRKLVVSSMELGSKSNPRRISLESHTQN